MFLGYKLKQNSRGGLPTPPPPLQTYLSGEKNDSQKRAGGNDQNGQYISLCSCLTYFAFSWPLLAILITYVRAGVADPASLLPDPDSANHKKKPDNLT